MEVDVAEARHHQVQAVGLVQPRDVFLEAEAVDDLTGAGREALDVVRQVRRDVVRVAFQLLEGEAAGVVERHARCLGELRVQHPGTFVGVLLLGLQDLVLRRSQDAVQPSQYRERQHNVFVLVRAIWPSDEVGD